MKLLIRGGSIAAGYGVARGYVDILYDYCTPAGIELINKSRPGDNSFDGVWFFDEDINPHQPDILILHFGMDDAFASVYRSEFKENLVNMIRMSRSRFNPVIVLPTSHILDNPHEMEAVHIYYRTIREVSLDLECLMVPVHTFWAGFLVEKSISNTDLLQEDARYPNEKGHEVYADIIIRTVERLLAARQKQH